MKNVNKKVPMKSHRVVLSSGNLGNHAVGILTDDMCDTLLP